MPPKRRRATAAPVPPRGPNWQTNNLREQLVAQIKAAANHEAAEDPAIQQLLEEDISKRNAVMADTVYEFLHDPFVRQQPVINFTMEEKWALRSLRAAIENTLRDPSDVNKKVMTEELGKLVKLTRPETKVGDEKPWVPAALRDKNYPRLDPLTNLPEDRSRIAEQEGALEWRPAHMRTNKDQSLYEIKNPNIQHVDPFDDATWDSLRNNQPITWDFTSTDEEPDKKDNRKKKKKREQREDSVDGENVKKQRGDGSDQDDDMVNNELENDKMQVDDDGDGEADGGEAGDPDTTDAS